jgi:metal-responsive CopG/Arc/MetJ family transcriptional regulator
MKERISITIDKNLLAWVDEKVAARIFSNRSHALEFLVMRRMREEEGFQSYHANVAREELEKHG